MFRQAASRSAPAPLSIFPIKVDRETPIFALALVYCRWEDPRVRLRFSNPWDIAQHMKSPKWLSLAMLLPAAGWSLGADPAPIKLSVEVSSHSVQGDEKIVIQVGLL